MAISVHGATKAISSGCHDGPVAALSVLQVWGTSGQRAFESSGDEVPDQSAHLGASCATTSIKLLLTTCRRAALIRIIGVYSARHGSVLRVRYPSLRHGCLPSPNAAEQGAETPGSERPEPKSEMALMWIASGWPTHPRQSVRKPLRLVIDFHSIVMTTLPL